MTRTFHKYILPGYQWKCGFHFSSFLSHQLLILVPQIPYSNSLSEGFRVTQAWSWTCDTEQIDLPFIFLSGPQFPYLLNGDSNTDSSSSLFVSSPCTDSLKEMLGWCQSGKTEVQSDSKGREGKEKDKVETKKKTKNWRCQRPRSQSHTAPNITEANVKREDWSLIQV